MAVFPIARWAVLGLVLVFAIVVLGLDAHLTDVLRKGEVVRPIEGLGLFTASITILSLPVMIAVDILRQGAFTSMIIVELGWLFLLWVFWLATAALASDTHSASFVVSCDNYIGLAKTLCNEISAIEGLSYVNWILLMVYTIVVLVFALIANSRGHPNIWSATISELPYSNPNATAAPPNTVSMVQTPAPIQQPQAQYPPAGYPPQSPPQGQPQYPAPTGTPSVAQV